MREVPGSIPGAAPCARIAALTERCSWMLRASFVFVCECHRPRGARARELSTRRSRRAGALAVADGTGLDAARCQARAAPLALPACAAASVCRVAAPAAAGKRCQPTARNPAQVARPNSGPLPCDAQPLLRSHPQQKHNWRPRRSQRTLRCPYDAPSRRAGLRILGARQLIARGASSAVRDGGRSAGGATR